MGCNATSLLADAGQHKTQMHSLYVHATTSLSKCDAKNSHGKLSAQEAAWAVLLMSLSRRVIKPVKCMMDSTVKASNANSGWMVQPIPAGLLLHVVAHRMLGYGGDCMNT